MPIPANCKIASYVGCQANRPLGVVGESFENQKYLDRLTEAMGVQVLDKYEQKVTCCDGAFAFSEPEKSQAQIKKIIESAYDHGADMIVTPCPVCQMNVEIYQGQINKTYGTKFKMPVVYYSQLMTVAYDGSAKGETEGPRVSGEHSRRRTGTPWTACPGFSSGAR